MTDPLTLMLDKAREQRDVAPEYVPEVPEMPEQPEAAKAKGKELRKVRLTEAEWKAIHSRNPYTVFDVRGTQPPHGGGVHMRVPRIGDRGSDAVAPRFMTRLGPGWAILWRHDAACPGCQAIACYLLVTGQGGVVKCFGCYQTVATVDEEIDRRLRAEDDKAARIKSLEDREKDLRDAEERVKKAEAEQKAKDDTPEAKKKKAEQKAKDKLLKTKEREADKKADSTTKS